MTTKIIVEDYVMPQLFTSAIEAYEFEHRAHRNGRGIRELETYGLLWGYVLPERHGQRKRIVCTHTTVETSALREHGAVTPNLKSLKMKKDFFQKYWSHLELVGTFHTHPYDSLEDVNRIKGWRASEDDKKHWEWIHERLCPELPCMAHIIITITALQRIGSAPPQPLSGNECGKGFVLSSDWRKFWIKGYSSELDEEEDEDGDVESFYHFSEKIHLDIPSLEKRFL
jgi:hypothetical protein